MPLISVIIPVYNRPDLVVETIESVLAQTFTDREIIIIDDGSTDRTPEVLSLYKDRVKLIRQENQGLGAARNRALADAAGEYVLFLDSDDLLFPWSLARFAEAIQSNHRPAIVLGALANFSKSRPLGPVSDAPIRERAYADYLASWREPAWLAPSGTVVRADYLRQAGGFSTKRMTHEENDAWMRVGTAPGFVRMDAPICCARREHDANLSIFSVVSARSTAYLLDQERDGKYPGGAARSLERHAYLGMHVRPMALSCLRARYFRWGWRLYWRTFGWNLGLMRVQFLVAFPLIAVLRGFAALFKPASHAARAGMENAARRHFAPGITDVAGNEGDTKG